MIEINTYRRALAEIKELSDAADYTNCDDKLISELFLARCEIPSKPETHQEIADHCAHKVALAAVIVHRWRASQQPKDDDENRPPIGDDDDDDAAEDGKNWASDN